MAAPASPWSASREPVAAPRWRFRFTLLTALATVALVSWGGFVTSIDAGMSVPDWPSSFGSYDPFKTGLYDAEDPRVRWYKSVPVLAEHGHRLLGALVGLLTLVLAGWTWRADPRRWMRRLGLGALALVALQGTLGGLRVTENSLFLAGVHACTAQIFVALLVAMAVFTTRTWLVAPTGLTGASAPLASGAARRLRRLTWAAAGVLYGQIVLGALLRHAGHGVDAVFAGIHIAGAFAVTALVFAVFVVVQKHFGGVAALGRGAWAMLGVVGAQFALGLAAYVVMLYEAPLAVRSAAQITLNTAHLVTASLLLAATVTTALLARRLLARRPLASRSLASRSLAPRRPPEATAPEAAAPEAAAPAGGDSAAEVPVLALRAAEARAAKTSAAETSVTEAPGADRERVA